MSTPAESGPRDPAVRPRPGATRRARGGRWVRPSDLVGLVTALVALALVEPLAGYRIAIALVLSYAIVCAGLVLLVGVAGQLSLGSAIFIAIGAFTAANITSRTPYGLELEVPLAAVIAFVVGCVVGLPTLRVSDLFLALATLALSFAGQQILFEWEAISGGGAGLRVGPLRAFGQTLQGPTAVVVVGIVLLAVVFWVVRNLLGGRTGRALHAIRTSESAAATVVAANVAWLKILAFGLSGAVAAIGGVLYMHTIAYTGPENYDSELSILVVLTVIIGGAHRLVGALLGPLFVFGLPELLRGVQAYEGMLYGALLLAVMLYLPGGLAGLVERGAHLVRRRDDPVGRGRTDGPTVSATPAPAATEEEGGPAAVEGLGLRLEEVRVEFGGLPAVAGVSVDVRAGELVGVIGPNGAGKTTVFNAITGLVRGTGRIVLDDGTELHTLSARRRCLAGVSRTFQNLNLHLDRTVLDHVLLGADRYAGYDRFSEALRLPWAVVRERRLEEEGRALLDQLGIGDVADAVVASLPYGVKKRVDVARALASRPRVLLLDEPAAGLPHHEAEELIDVVLRLTRGVTVLLIEHNVELVRRTCPRIVVMDAGTVLADGPPEECLADEAVVRAYLGV